MPIRPLLLLLLLLPGFCSPAQPAKVGDEGVQFRRRMASLAPVQRFEPTAEYTRTLMNRSQLAEARPLLEKALVTARQVGNVFWIGKFCALLAHLESITGNSKLAVDYYLQALHIFQTIHAYDQQQLVCYDISNEYLRARLPIPNF